MANGIPGVDVCVMERPIFMNDTTLLAADHLQSRHMRDYLLFKGSLLRERRFLGIYNNENIIHFEKLLSLRIKYTL